MEWIGVGIAVAIGFYLAPIVLTTVFGAVILIGHAICRLFGGCK